MWNDLFTLGISVPDKIIRTIVVYLGLALLLRVAGKRDLAQLNSFDLVVMLLLSNVVQNAVIGNDLSLAGGLLGAAVLVGFNAFMVRVSLRSDRMFRLLEGTRTVLGRNGHWEPKALRHEGLRQADVDAALRRQNATGIADVETVSLEPGGAVVATLRPGLEPATKSDVAALLSGLAHADDHRITRLEAKLDEVLARLDARDV
ncbi:MAG: DUF421 domain-containing protein [Nocardioides sp.]